jgi:hypothetical protein
MNMKIKIENELTVWVVDDVSCIKGDRVVGAQHHAAAIVHPSVMKYSIPIGLENFVTNVNNENDTIQKTMGYTPHLVLYRVIFG